MIQLVHGDCLEEMKKIPDRSVDMVLTDPPYGTTACKWDTVIPLEPMWEQLKRVIKPNGAIVMTASQPFTSALIMSNIKMFKYEWIWEKQKASNFMTSKYQPMKYHENIIVFSKNKSVYNPLKWNQEIDKIDKRKTINSTKNNRDNIYGELIVTRKKDDGTRYPKSIIKINKDININLHPTQKPVALMEYLIKTYTNETETVLDFTMGSGTTGVACKNLNRNFIGIELDETYFNIAKQRIDVHTV